MSLLPKPTLTDYTFLKTPKNRSYFILSRQKAARDHVKRKWSNQNGTTKTPRQAFEEYKETHQERKLFDPDRIETLHQVLEVAIAEWTTFRPILAEIKNEYSLVINALVNILNERQFLQSKIKQLLCTIATPAQLRETRMKLSKLKYQFEKLKKNNELSVLEMSDAEIKFVEHIYLQYEIEMDKFNIQKNTKAKKDLCILGKWQFFKDWVDYRKDHDWVMKDLYDSIDKKSALFISYIEEEKEMKILDSDSAEVRKMKLHIESLWKAHRLHDADLEIMERRELFLHSQLDCINMKIQNIQELAELNGITPRKSNLVSGMSRKGSPVRKHSLRPESSGPLFPK